MPASVRQSWCAVSLAAASQTPNEPTVHASGPKGGQEDFPHWPHIVAAVVGPIAALPPLATLTEHNPPLSPPSSEDPNLSLSGKRTVINKY